MKLKDWIAFMEGVAPPELALDWDNVGLLVSPEREELSRVLVALDCTPEVAREAAASASELDLCHHPLYFKPVRRMLYDAPETAAACLLVRHGVGHYAAHTNLDAALGGVNDVLAGLFGVRGEPFGEGLGRIGALPEPETLASLAKRASALLGAQVACVGEADRPIRRAAFLGGACGDELRAAKAAGAELLITGELKHNAALDARFLGLCCIVAGHHETERIILKPLIERLQAAADDVQYILAQSDTAPFAAV
ncbi:MAG: Nif3-like dinuclear metal center hexameric protein [Clostridia bacterium]|nr:Nif3-like dinuclear metal center hexameric protein [Clostridia bacterium]